MKTQKFEGFFVKFTVHQSQRPTPQDVTEILRRWKSRIEVGVASPVFYDAGPENGHDQEFFLVTILTFGVEAAQRHVHRLVKALKREFTCEVTVYAGLELVEMDRTNITLEVVHH